MCSHHRACCPPRHATQALRREAGVRHGLRRFRSATNIRDHEIGHAGIERALDGRHVIRRHAHHSVRWRIFCSEHEHADGGQIGRRMLHVEQQPVEARLQNNFSDRQMRKIAPEPNQNLVSSELLFERVDGQAVHAISLPTIFHFDPQIQARRMSISRTDISSPIGQPPMAGKSLRLPGERINERDLFSE